MLSLYIATAYADAHVVESAIRPAAESRGITVCSSWHVGAHRSERLDAMTTAQVRAIADRNDRDLASADVVLVLESDRARETYAELRHALHLGKPVAYVGSRPMLSAYREGVQRFSAVGDALTWIAGLAPKRDPNRCAVCGWSLASVRSDGCVPGDCAARPRPERLFDPARAAAEVRRVG